MKLVDILEKAINKEFAYDAALGELKKLNLPYEEEQKYELLLHKLLGNTKKTLYDDNKYFFEGIPNSNYLPILQEVISLIRGGLYSPEIAQHIFEKYQISSPLMAYFINEALSIVRMNNLSPEEISSIGEAYHQIASNLERKGLKDKPEVQSEENINAEEVGDIELYTDD